MEPFQLAFSVYRWFDSSLELHFYRKFVDKVDDPDYGGSCLEGTPCCFLCPDQEKANYKVPVIDCADKFAPNGCATAGGEGCTCEPLADDADMFSGKDLLTELQINSKVQRVDQSIFWDRSLP